MFGKKKKMGRPKREEYIKLTTTLDEVTCRRLTYEAKRLGKSRSRLVEEILNECFFRRENRFSLALKTKLNLIKHIVSNNDDERRERKFLDFYLKEEREAAR